MRNVVVSSFATLDGRVDELQDWARPYNEAPQAAYHDELLANAEGLLLGRNTYQIFAFIWPPRAGELPYIDKMNSLPKYVASSTLDQLDWENSHLIKGDVAQAVAELKQGGDGDLIVYGGQDFIQTLLDNGLVDEYRVLVSPVLLGKGRRLQNDGAAQANLELLGSSVIDPGILLLRYRPVS